MNAKIHKTLSTQKLLRKKHTNKMPLKMLLYKLRFS